MRAVHVFISYSERLSELTMKMQLFQRFIFCFNTGQCQVPNIPDAELVGGRELAYVNHETVIEFRCMAGLVPRDSANIKCDNGTWSSKPECIPGKWVWFFAKKGKLRLRQANLCLRVFRHDKFQLRMPSHSEGPGIGFSIWRFLLIHCFYERAAKVLARLRACAGSPEPSLLA